ncbi:hypothetical protein ACFL6H_01775 [Candidatus Latescibacterota bacterium]
MQKNTSAKARRFIYIMVVFFLCLVFQTHADEIEALQWNSSHIISLNSGVSLLKFSSSGLGVYPYAYSTPGLGLNVYIDSVPLRSLSPFGPDLELVPSQFTSSIEYDGWDELNIVTKDITDDETEPFTDTGFLIGSRRRFNFDIIFNRSLSERSGIIIGGSSSGIHGGENTEKNALRAYYLKYRNKLENDSAVTFSIQSFRDRDGLIDLDNVTLSNGRKAGTHMGERRTDNLSVSLGVDAYPLGSETSVSPTLYFQSANSRFDHYGLRKSLDEKSAGLNVFLSRKSGDNIYRIHAMNDSRFFNSRLHEETWTRNESELSVSFNRRKDKYRLHLESGFINSSKYGSGGKIKGEYALLTQPGHEIILRGISSERFPDTGQEYYTSLIYSDTTLVSNVDKFNISQIESGVRFNKENYNLEVFAFGSYSKLPLFEVSPQLYNRVTYALPAINTTHIRMSSREKSYGYRVSADTHFEKLYAFDAAFNFSQRPGENNVNYYPSFEFNSNIQMSGNFINNKMKTTAFMNAGILRWNNSDITPNGNHFLIDCGLLIHVSTLQLFYRIENVLNEDIEWFNSMGWLGRNAMWGGKWVFYD